MPTLEFRVDAYVYIEAGPDRPSLDQQYARVRFGPGLARLLLAVHCRLIFTRDTCVRMTFEELGQALWGPTSLRPNGWRAEIRKFVEIALLVSVDVAKKSSANGPAWNFSLLTQADEDATGYVFRVDRETLFQYEPFVNADGTLDIKEKPDADEYSAVTSADIEDLRKDGEHGPLHELRKVIRARRKRNADSQLTLSQLAQLQFVTNVFVPAWLGDRRACQECGPLAQCLIREKTRRKPIAHAMVPARSMGGNVRCPLLDPEKSYVAFAANDARRQQGTRFAGRGYLLKTWAKKFDCNPAEFLERLAAGRERLGLIVAAVDRDNTWYSLDDLLAEPVEVWGQVMLRVYTEEDYPRRWCDAFGWRFETDDAAPVATEFMGIAARA